MGNNVRAQKSHPLWLLTVFLGANTGDPALDVLINGGPVGILALMVVGFWRGWIVPGKELAEERNRTKAEADQLRSERDKALDLVFAQAELASRALAVGEKVKDETQKA
jgi:hypothetical protein